MKSVVLAVALHQERRPKERSKEHNRLLKLGCIAGLAVRERILVVKGGHHCTAGTDISEPAGAYLAGLHDDVRRNR